MGVGFVPAGKLCCEPVDAATVPVDGTRAPPPVASCVLSMALETTADNLYFQVSAGVML